MSETTPRHYLVLLGLKKENARHGPRALANLQQRVDSGASTLWIDGHGVGIVCTTTMSASEIWPHAIFEADALSDVLVIEIGSDWAARNETRHHGWLITHLGIPRWPSRPR